MSLGIAGICMTFAAFPLPETQKEPLPQSLVDMKKMKMKTKLEGCTWRKRESVEEEGEREEEEEMKV